MCGILTVCGIQSDANELRKKIIKEVKKLRHRGPDWSGIYSDESAILAHERLAIVDIDSGAQPLISTDGNLVLAVNGEIYNHKELSQYTTSKHQSITKSDCEPILHLYKDHKEKCVDYLNGIFGFVLYDKENNDFFIARDHVGIIPLYWGRDEHGNIYVASEAKALLELCQTVEDFPPGHYYRGKEKKLVKYYNPVWAEENHYPTAVLDLKKLRTSLEDAVKRQMMSDVPYGVLLSGGLDSSIIAGIAAKFQKDRIESEGKSPAWWPRMHSFAVGLEDSPDLKASQKVADSLGTIHHQMVYTIQEGIDALRDVIYQLETFDVTTIRASTPMYLMARKIKTIGVKMVLSGEGADEIFGGYLYFHKAPNAQEFHDENVRKIGMLHKYDCLRANKSMSSWGVEARVPFLDKEFLDVSMTIDPKEKMITPEKKEKYILRKAFEDLLPKEIVWRQKEQFSDGVGYNWIDSLIANAEANITDEQLNMATQRFPINPPATKEAYFYREIFEEHFKIPSLLKCIPEGPTVACSSPTAFRWDKEFAKMADPSGRALTGVHNKAYKK
ncbi:asparagine synthase B [Bacteriovoracaceae bacterium]|nr:asparagine synthase B [Bacteriovoracaceae bacterium]